MIASAIRFFLANYSLSFLLLALLCALARLIGQRRSATPHFVFESFLFYYCLFAIGFNYLYNFVMHVFFSQMAAHFIGWRTSPFQTEVGFASLGFAVVGFFALRPEWGRRVAAVIGPAFFLWGAAGGHIYHMIADHNFAPGNAGMVFWTDLLLPVIGIILLIGWRRTANVISNAGAIRHVNDANG